MAIENPSLLVTTNGLNRSALKSSSRSLLTKKNMRLPQLNRNSDLARKNHTRVAATLALRAPIDQTNAMEMTLPNFSLRAPQIQPSSLGGKTVYLRDLCAPC
jgi:hypothetical protein